MLKHIFIAFATLLAISWAFPTGAPPTVCDSMLPGHNESLPQAVPLKQKFTVSNSEVKAEEDVKIVVSGPDFKGFMVEVRAKDQNKAVGQFVDVDAKISQTIDCHGNKDSAITHVDKEPKKEVTLTWKAPKEQGEYIVWGTIVESYEVFWAKEKVATLTVI
ncbi:unnamed protein product [Brassicogethes aeneus]|uniref:Reelin domain-containing protein n=1 Tax=Brassicogethes aeneus TaxID=1431903 RepID=A0A9P0FIX2_BRAAE|nr:unnamed protein product [Brassicogethes aeneus]